MGSARLGWRSRPKPTTEFRFVGGELDRWACLGAVTDRSVRLWLRDPRGGPQPATLEIDGEPVARCELDPQAEHDWIAAADLTLDQPRPDAAISVQVEDVERRTRLAPAVGTPTAFSFAFGSCHQPFESSPDGSVFAHPGAGLYWAMVRTLRARDARFLLLLGDQVYSDGVPSIQVRHGFKDRGALPAEDELRAIYRRIYRGYFNEPGFRALLEGWPTYTIWDDHDICEGWGSMLDEDELDRRLFRAAEATYREYQHLHNAGTSIDDTAPYHYRFWFGDTGFFTFDLRGMRDFRAGRLLGDRQWRDLEAFLDEADERGVPTLFFNASVPVVHVSPLLDDALEWLPGDEGTDVRDRWCSTPIEPEREALMNRLFAWQAARPKRQVVVLSGDVHVGAAFRCRHPKGRGLIRQWTSSPLSTPTGLVDHLTNRVATALVNLGERCCHATREALVFDNNFGLVAVTPLPTGGHQVELTLYAYDHRRRDVRAATRVMARPSG